VVALLVAATGQAGELRALRANAAGGLVLELSRGVAVEVTPVRTVDGGIARLYVDLPAGTVAARSVPRRPPRGLIRSLRLGRGDAGQLRLVVEVQGADRYDLSRTRDGCQVSVALRAPEKERRPPPAPPRAPVPPVVARITRSPRIVLDPGHGGRDPGAQGHAVEKEVTLAIAGDLATLLRERLGAQVVMTRSDDRTMSLAERTARANAEAADLFVSIHANAQDGDSLHGIETYYLDNTDDRGTIRLAALENGLPPMDRPKGGSDLRYILSDLLQVGKMDESIALANTVQRGLVNHLRGRYGGVEDLGVKRGPFYVLVGAHMPCILVETSFLTHPIEGRRLVTREYRAAIAEGLYNGIARFLADSVRVRTL
jgi:N-acetylmuramoyl-L-alanine amidase